MSEAWYYVLGSERVGPIDRSELETLFGDGTIGMESYVWKKGFDNWKVLKTVEELESLYATSSDEVPSFDSLEDIPVVSEEEEMPEEIQEDDTEDFDLYSIGEEEKVFSIKIGLDRGSEEAEYGPFSLVQLRRAYSEKRINGKTYIFTPGMENWILLGDFELFETISGEAPPSISPEDRREAQRKPFIARMFFHDNREVFEGICRDISVGGLQVLVADFPARVGEEVSMNVHPDNSEYCFTASGVIVRKLEGNSGFSLRFDNLSEDAMQAISSYINA